MPPYILTHNVELTTLIHKIIVSIVASAHGLRYDHINVFQGVGATPLNSGILSRLPVYQPYRTKTPRMILNALNRQILMYAKFQVYLNM